MNNSNEKLKTKTNMLGESRGARQISAKRILSHNHFKPMKKARALDDSPMGSESNMRNACNVEYSGGAVALTFRCVPVADVRLLFIQFD